MKPNQTDKNNKKETLPPQGPISVTPQQRPFLSPQQAAANVIRTQIDNLYTEKKAPPTDNTDPYQRTQDRHKTLQSDQWKRYHSAWQDYYQKYYD
jgi:hypothetical protein